MPIGFDRGDHGGGAPTFDVHLPTLEAALWTWIEIVQQILTPIVFTRWVTQGDERVCPECGPLDGLVWEESDGPSPPLHVNCRCTRMHAFTEWQVRT